MKDGVLYPASGVYGINDNIVSSDTGWSSQKVMNKLASIKSIMRVDEKPTITDGTITYIKDGTTYTTTDSETWFYYVIDNELYKTIFIDGVEYTKADSNVSFDDFIEKSAIVTTLDDTVTNEQVPSAKTVYDLTKNKDLKSYTDVSQLGITDVTDLTAIATTLPENSCLVQFILDQPSFPRLYGTLFVLKKRYDNVVFKFYPNGDNEANAEYKCGYHPFTGVSTWKKVCMTNVPDVPKTQLGLTLPSTLTVGANGIRVEYIVVSGVCEMFIYAHLLANTFTGYSTISTGMPIPMLWDAGVDILPTDSRNPYLKCAVTYSGELRILIPEEFNGDGAYWTGTLRYKVAEDWRP